MSHPGSFPGDPAGQQPSGQPYPPPGFFEYPPVYYGTLPPAVYPAPPAAYSPPSQMPQGAYPPPPPYLPHNSYQAPHPSPYGYPYGNPYPPAYCGQPATNGMAIGSLVSSLVGIPAYFMCLPFVGSIVGVILGIVALNPIGSCHQRGREMAIAGIAIGGVCLIGGLVVVLLYSATFFSY
ncbi:MAG TPA: DUF4190 domain-containing protein [Mycobacterium sp.]|nr:DUF4190 domain-containing protein [Mycobacterium sp.]